MKLQLDPNSSKPLHQQAEDLLRQMIQQEEYRKGKLLPNEVELSKELNISRNTLRQAINRLVFEGLLIRKKGYGTTVAPQNVMSNARNWMSFSQEMHAQGMVVQISNYTSAARRRRPRLPSFSTPRKEPGCCAWSACADARTYRSSISSPISTPRSR